jgi:hypothetical protein
VRETNIPKDTLYTWRSKAFKGGTPSQLTATEGLVARRNSTSSSVGYAGDLAEAWGNAILESPLSYRRLPLSRDFVKTLKNHFPNKPFDCLEEARNWAVGFQYWYNEVQRHSALKFITPGQRHRGEDITILVLFTRALRGNNKKLDTEQYTLIQGNQEKTRQNLNKILDKKATSSLTSTGSNKNTDLLKCICVMIGEEKTHF